MRDETLTSEETIYNKLVRDRIPEIIESQGRAATAKLASGPRGHTDLLIEKLTEETEEFREST